MIKVNNLCRTYKPKRGVPVKALDNVSLVLPDKGMVFILGKSGSGKSTFLNVLGGLDKYDSGEIIIKGKSSKDFSQNDFDSYRNTYLGFIFQEYNILKDFTVGANIALAIELQGRKASSEEVNKILEEVDLVGYEHRKPNELSGGQMQRVAIARALVKNPEIIMADEPTGALDSNTGKAVFDTLKKLSKDKLVVIVSHDREFAEDYADRIIEFKDGKVISDVEQTVITAPNTEVQVIDERIIRIKKGYVLTSEDAKKIADYINNSPEGAIISLEEETNESIQKDARIADDGSLTTFIDTNEENIVHNDNENFKLIKSRLSVKNALKMGASSLKVKRFRLVITIILSFVAFALFGLANTMGMYNKVDASTNSILDSNIDYASFSKINIKGYSSRNEKMSEADLNTLKEKTGIEYKGIYALSTNIMNNIECSSITYDSDYYRTFSMINGLIESSANEINDLGYDMIGTYPQNEKEIALSKATVSTFLKCGYSNTGYSDVSKDTYQSNISSYEDMLNKKININGELYTLTAIIDTNFDEARYEDTKQRPDSGYGIAYYIKYQELITISHYGYHTLLFVSNGSVGEFCPAISFEGVLFNNNNMYFSATTNKNSYISMTGFATSSSNEVVYFDTTKTSIGSTEAVISLNQFLSSYGSEAIAEYTKGNIALSNAYNTGRDNAVRNYATANINSAIEKGFVVSEGATQEEKINQYVNYLGNEGISVNAYGKSYNLIMSEYAYNYIKTNDLFPEEMYLNMIGADYRSGYEEIQKTYDIVGVYLDDFYLTSKNWVDEILLLNDDEYKNYEGTGGNFEFAVGKMPDDKSDIKKMVQFYYDGKAIEEGDYYDLNNASQYMINQINDTVETLAKVFFWVGFGFAVFASLLLFNFICISISYKRREIGVLRAVGARGRDVFNIFFCESLIIALINFVLASISFTVVIMVINNILRTKYGILITILNVGIIQYALILGISVAVAFISSYLPVFRIAHQRPIDAIREK